MRLVPPIEGFATETINTTLHGRSVYRSQDVPGHNVFKGWETWANNGHVGVGDGLDVEGVGWRTPVVAVCDGVQTVFRNDMTKLEVVYIEGDGVVAVYAHINAAYEGTGKRWKQGETIGVLRGDLNWPHVHFELWLDGKAVSDPTPEGLRAKMLGLFAPPSPEYTLVGLDGIARPGPWMGQDLHGYCAIAICADAANVNVTWDGSRKQWSFSPRS
jgi:murein DD-endopeptidase MepM/ murein hydrolase activator NlpD